MKKRIFVSIIFILSGFYQFCYASCYEEINRKVSIHYMWIGRSKLIHSPEDASQLIGITSESSFEINNRNIDVYFKQINPKDNKAASNIHNIMDRYILSALHNKAGYPSDLILSVQELFNRIKMDYFILYACLDDDYLIQALLFKNYTQNPINMPYVNTQNRSEIKNDFQSKVKISLIKQMEEDFPIVRCDVDIRLFSEEYTNYPMPSIKIATYVDGEVKRETTSNQYGHAKLKQIPVATKNSQLTLSSKNGNHTYMKIPMNESFWQTLTPEGIKNIKIRSYNGNRSPNYVSRKILILYKKMNTSEKITSLDATYKKHQFKLTSSNSIKRLRETDEEWMLKLPDDIDLDLFMISEWSAKIEFNSNMDLPIVIPFNWSYFLKKKVHQTNKRIQIISQLLQLNPPYSGGPSVTISSLQNIFDVIKTTIKFDQSKDACYISKLALGPKITNDIIKPIEQLILNRHLACECNKHFSVGQYKTDALELLHSLKSEGKLRNIKQSFDCLYK